jgi:transcriptional regulator with XRE-family HTH domain
MRDSFGARLRRHRELRGISLAEIAEKTKIKASMLDGLERDDISQWPTGIFRRAYVRAYAAAIGFDADTAVREFLVQHLEPIESLAPPPPPPSGLRGFFESFRRRAPGPPPVAAAEVATATVGKRPADATLAELDRPLAVVPPVSAAAKAASAPSSRKTSDVAAPAPATEDATTTAAADKRQPDLLAAACICTELGRADDVDQVLSLLGDAAKIVGARGLIVWVWDGGAGELKPALVHGYSPKVRARFRGVGATADNLIAATYRAGAPLARSGALAVPLLGPSACAGVLAIEVKDGREQDPAVRALATFFAAMLAQLVAVGASSDTTGPSETSPPLDPPVVTA